MTLFSAGLSLQTDEDDDYYFPGKGHSIYFEMFSNSMNSLDNGDSNFSSTEPCPIGTFDSSGYSINYDSENEESEGEGDILSGKVSVSNNGNEYS